MTVRSSISPIAVLGAALLASAFEGNAQTPRPATQTRLPSLTQVVERAAPATVTIITFDASGDTLAQGSGFILRGDGVVVTNWHVMEGATTAVVILASRERYERVAFFDGDSTADIAILKIPGFGLPTLRTTTSVPAVGERVFALGSPLGLSRTVSDGIVSALRIVGGKQLVQITAPISRGSSGGPVLDRMGRAFAITTLFLEEGQQLNFAVPVRYALGLLIESPTLRPLAEVFGAAPSAASVPPQPAAPPRSNSPRARLDGAYVVTQTWSGSGQSNGRSDDGYLLAASEHIGLLVVRRASDPNTSSGWSVYGVSSIRTGAGGQVAVDVGGVIYDGYQMDDGFFARGQATFRDTGNRYDLAMVATRHSFPLSSSTGLYSVQCRTTYRSGSYRGDPGNWTGYAAVALANDSIYIDLFLTNLSGGSTALYGRAPIRADGSFSVSSSTTSLGGSIRAGVMLADWLDRREGGARFEGTLRATRY